MKKLLKIFLSKSFLFSIPVVATLGAVVFAVLKYKNDSDTGLIIIVLGSAIFLAILVGWIFWLRSVKKKNARRNEAIAEQVIERAKRDVVNVRPEMRAELEGLSKSFEEGIQYLQDRGVGLSELPWYMVIGPPGHGKTTLIRESGFDFAGFKTRADYTDATRNCGWFFSDNAVLIDTAGRYAAGDQAAASNEEWVSLLNLIKEQRPERPINGILLALSVTEFKGLASQPQIRDYAASLRARVLEIMEVLGVRVPVYIVFTMTDVIAGFDYFFDGLTLKERDQWWGVTLEPNPASPPGELSSFDAGVSFEAAYRKFYDRLLNRRIQKLSLRRKAEARHATALFLKNLADIRDNLTLFSERLFHTSRFEEDFLFRGFYFTSGTQTERPAVDLTQSLNTILSLPEAADGDQIIDGGFAYPEVDDAQSYFVKELFGDVVIPDETLVELTAEETRKRKKLSGVSLIGSGVLAMLLSGLFIASCSQSRSHINTYHEAIAELRTIDFLGANTLGERVADWQQKQVSHAVASYEYVNSINNAWPSLGIYQAETARDSVRAEHNRIVLGLLEPYFNEVLPTIAKKIARSEDLEDITKHKQALRTYVVLGSEDHFLKLQNTTEERTHLKKHLVDVLEGFSDSLVASTGDGQGQVCPCSSRDVPALMVDDFIAYQANAAAAPFDNKNDPNIAAAFKSLGRNVSEASVFGEFIAALSDTFEAARNWSEITAPNLLSATGGSNHIANLFSDEPFIQTAYAGEAWNSRVEALDKIVRARLGEGGDWFNELQLNEQMQMLDLQEREDRVDAYINNLLPRYEKEFFKQWNSFLSEVAYAPFADLEAGEEAMELLSENPEDDENLFNLDYWQTRYEHLISGEQKTPFPIRVLFEVVRDHTRGFELIEDKHNYDYLAFIHDENEISRLNPYWDQVIQDFDGLMRELRGMDSAEALEAVRSVLDKKDGAIFKAYDYIENDFKEEVEDLDVSIDPMLDNLLVNPVLQVWEKVLDNAAEELNDIWEDAVWRSYSDNFVGRFPFDPSSNIDAPYDDFVAFFSEQLPAFVREELGALVDIEGGDRVIPKTWPAGRAGKGIAFDPASLNDIRYGLRIEDGVAFDARLTAKEGHRRLRIHIGGDELDFSKPTTNLPYKFDGTSTRIVYKYRVLITNELNPDIEISDRVWSFLRFVYSRKDVRGDLYEFDPPANSPTKSSKYSVLIEVPKGDNPLKSRGYYSAFSPKSHLVVTH